MGKKDKYEEEFDESKIGKPSKKFFGLAAALIGALVLIILFFTFREQISQFFGF